MNEMLKESLAGLHASGDRHLELIQSDISIQEYYEKRQELLKAQAEEVQDSILHIRKKYQTCLWQLEQEYAVYVNMITPHKEQ